MSEMDDLAAFAVLIEAGTSREKRRGVVDKLAAQVILQSYLDTAAGPGSGDGADDAGGAP